MGFEKIAYPPFLFGKWCTKHAVGIENLNGLYSISKLNSKLNFNILRGVQRNQGDLIKKKQNVG